MDCYWCNDPSARCNEHSPKGSYSIDRRVSIDMKFSKKRLLEIFADERCWSSDGQFNKIWAIKILRDEDLPGGLGLKDAKELIEEFMQAVFGAMAANNIT